MENEIKRGVTTEMACNEQIYTNVCLDRLVTSHADYVNSSIGAILVSPCFRWFERGWDAMKIDEATNVAKKR